MRYLDFCTYCIFMLYLFLNYGFIICILPYCELKCNYNLFMLPFFRIERIFLKLAFVCIENLEPVMYQMEIAAMVKDTKLHIKRLWYQGFMFFVIKIFRLSNCISVMFNTHKIDEIFYLKLRKCNFTAFFRQSYRCTFFFKNASTNLD